MRSATSWAAWSVLRCERKPKAASLSTHRSSVGAQEVMVPLAQMR